jgi:hypothetical protein
MAALVRPDAMSPISFVALNELFKKSAVSLFLNLIVLCNIGLGVVPATLYVATLIAPVRELEVFQYK